jgi:hypothetical protein
MHGSVRNALMSKPYSFSVTFRPSEGRAEKLRYENGTAAGPKMNPTADDY